MTQSLSPASVAFGSIATPEPSLPSGTRLGAYEIVGPIAAGGMGEVYRAQDGRLARDVARPVPAGGAGGVGVESSARDRRVNLTADGPLERRKALKIVFQVAEAFTAAHAAGIVHRDLEPENVMVAVAREVCKCRDATSAVAPGVGTGTSAEGWIADAAGAG